MNIERIRQVDRNGNISYRIERDGVHLGDVLKTASGKYRPEMVTGAHGPNGTLKAGTEWLHLYAAPSCEAIREEIQKTTRLIEQTLPAQIHDARYTRPHARRLTSLRNQSKAAEQKLARLVTELGSAVQAEAAQYPTNDLGTHRPTDKTELGYTRRVCAACGVDWTCPEAVQWREARIEREMRSAQ